MAEMPFQGAQGAAQPHPSSVHLPRGAVEDRGEDGCKEQLTSALCWGKAHQQRGVKSWLFPPLFSFSRILVFLTPYKLLCPQQKELLGLREAEKSSISQEH